MKKVLAATTVAKDYVLTPYAPATKIFTKAEVTNVNNARKKVLIITNHSYMLYRFRKELIAELQRKHDVVLSMPFVGHEEDFQKMGLRCINTDVDRRGINPVTDLGLIKSYFDLLRQEKPDMVITYSIKPNIYAGLLCNLMNIPYYVNVQGLGTAFQKKGLAEFVTLLYKAALSGAGKVFFENEGNAKEFRDRKIMKKEKQVVLSGAGINLENYTYCAYPENEKAHFLYLGRIMKEKGMDELFASVKKLHEEGEEFVLDLVGFYEDSYKNQVEELEKMGVVVYHGFQENPKPFYENSDCVILPSYHEGMSNVLLEGAATGRPLITSDIFGCKEAVEEGVTGLLCKVKDTDSLYDKMKEFLRFSREERDLMGQKGREKMEREFDKKVVVAKTRVALVGE